MSRGIARIKSTRSFCGMTLTLQERHKPSDFLPQHWVCLVGDPAENASSV
jgi:hypothetical protein